MARGRKNTSPLISASPLAAEWHLEKNPSADQIYSTDRNSFWWKCAQGHEWTASPQCRTRFSTGCPNCVRSAVAPAKSIAALYPDLAAEWSETNLRSPNTVAPDSCLKFGWNCRTCAYSWEATPSNRTRAGSGCPKCAGKVLTPCRSVSSLSFAEEWRSIKNLPLLPTEVFAGSDTKIWWSCPRGHEYVASPKTRKRNQSAGSGNGCPYCSSKILDASNHLGALRPDLALEYSPRNEFPISHYAPHTDRVVWWRCPCGHADYQTPVSSRTRQSEARGCPACSISHTGLEKAFEALMGCEKFNKNLPNLKGYRPDFLFPETKICVNVDGLYWHTQRPRGYHRDMRVAVEAAGYRLFQFYEDEMKERPEVVKAILAVALGKVRDRRNARAGEIVPVDHPEANEFLAAHHLIGAVPSSKHLGLRVDGVLLALTSYRIGLRGIELTRLCSAPNVIVRGGATRLLRHIRLKHPYEDVRTLIDHRYATTTNWEAWGFVKIAERLGYQYTDRRYARKDKRHFRVPGGVDEEAAAASKGWYRIYDAGKTTLLLSAAITSR